MKKISFSALALLLAASAFSQKSFEGQIDCIKYDGIDTTNFSYYVKTPHVKILGTDKDKDEGIYLIDLSTKKTLVLSPYRKIYKEEHFDGTVKHNDSTKVTKTANTKTLNGYKCTEYIVENAKDNCRITYWIASGNFDFFLPMMNVFIVKDKFNQYYMEIPNSANMCPMESIETDMKGTTIAFMKAIKVTPGKVSDGEFAIPDGYSKMDK
ncbi:MAG: DUF4412 domain-containing protein [Bacteroidia bacterium]